MNESQNTDIETAIWQEEDTEPTETTEEQGPDLADRVVSLLETYWRRRKLACGIVAAGIVLSVAYSLTLKNYYRSTTTLMPPDDSSPYSSMLGMLSGASTSESLGSTAFGLSTPGDLQVSILESR